LAAKNGRTAMAELLLAHKANVNATDNSGETQRGKIFKAAVEADCAIVEALLQASPELIKARNLGGDTLLHAAMHFMGHKEIVDLLLAKGADINAQNKEGKTPLQKAWESGNYELVDILLAHGAKE
jgi:ankyrin repeat protein